MRGSGLRAWAMEGTGGYGAGLARHLADAGELVVELDRPKRPARRAGAKSDPIDAERAARGALARTHLAQPKTGAERAALQMRLTARRAAVEAATAAQRQLLALAIAAPETVRARFRGQNTHAMLTVAALRSDRPRLLRTVNAWRGNAAVEPRAHGLGLLPQPAAAQRGDTLRRRRAVHGAGWPEHLRNRELVRRLLSRHRQQLHLPEPVHHLRSGVLLRSADDLQAVHEPDRSRYMGNRTSRPIFREDAPSSPITAGSPCSYMPKLPPRSSNVTSSVRLTLTH
jgi:hypothetical protein